MPSTTQQKARPAGSRDMTSHLFPNGIAGCLTRGARYVGTIGRLALPWRPCPAYHTRHTQHEGEEIRVHEISHYGAVKQITPRIPRSHTILLASHQALRRRKIRYGSDHANPLRAVRCYARPEACPRCQISSVRPQKGCVVSNRVSILLARKE